MIIPEVHLYRRYRVIVEHLIVAMITKIDFGYYDKEKQLDLNELLDDCIEELKLKNGERKIILKEVEKVIKKTKSK